MEVSLRGLGGEVCKEYPASISYAQLTACALWPWSDTCQRLREQSDLECGQFSGALALPQIPRSAGAPPSEGLTTAPGVSPRSQQEIINEIVRNSSAENQARIDEWIKVQSANADAREKADRVCGAFSSVNSLGICMFDPSKPLFITLVAVAVVALVAFGRR